MVVNLLDLPFLLPPFCHALTCPYPCMYIYISTSNQAFCIPMCPRNLFRQRYSAWNTPHLLNLKHQFQFVWTLRSSPNTKRFGQILDSSFIFRWEQHKSQHHIQEYLQTSLSLLDPRQHIPIHLIKQAYLTPLTIYHLTWCKSDDLTIFSQTFGSGSHSSLFVSSSFCCQNHSLNVCPHAGVLFCWHIRCHVPCRLAKKNLTRTSHQSNLFLTL